MAHKIIWSPEAVADLEEIRDYIARNSETYAAALAERILFSIDRFAYFPQLGQRVPELGDDSVRQLVVESFRVIYRVRPESTDIAAIIHGARDLPDALSERAP